MLCLGSSLKPQTHTHFLSLHTWSCHILADGIRADAGRPARLCAIAPSSRAAVCLTTWRTGEQTGEQTRARAARYTIYPRGCVAWRSLPQPWHKPWPKMKALCPCCRPLPPPPAPAPSMARTPALSNFTIHPRTRQLALDDNTQLCLRCRWDEKHWKLNAGFHALGYECVAYLHPLSQTLSMDVSLSAF